MCSEFLYHAMCIFLLITMTQCKLDDNVILTYTNKEYINKVYSDGSTVVFGTFTKDNHLLDCDIRAVNGTVSANIFKEALTNKDTEADIQPMDIKRMARQCKRFIRKMSVLTFLFVRSVTVQDVEKHTITSAMQIKYKLFNHTPWSLYSCDCWKKFNNCIHQLPPSQIISDLETAFFNNIKSQCFTTDSKQTCDKWSEWFTACDHSTTETVASFNFVTDLLK
ncbi:hypothetical protein LOTGIDRAFT_159436 [Lottia gigantea]|uniref:Phospholipase A2-like central domain-containing protein n=1 Tax=Lottia gigantea TaxID=225164 RepID=V4ARG6_LOTGI|nr:hypothetical protein LOTGIDRAFT_159436 [Lottia gigantea]ESO97405.1 hypothetical protein LOTGIDRAFT_159436 [Lottia gigantea]